MKKIYLQPEYNEIKSVSTAYGILKNSIDSNLDNPPTQDVGGDDEDAGSKKRDFFSDGLW
mgnify:CR=1 FL=1